MLQQLDGEIFMSYGDKVSTPQIDGDNDIDTKSGLSGIGNHTANQRAGLYAWYRDKQPSYYTDSAQSWLERFESYHGHVNPPKFRNSDRDGYGIAEYHDRSTIEFKRTKF